jgi:hypothetical protein
VNLAESIAFREFAASNLALAVIATCIFPFRLIWWKIRCKLKGDRLLENDSLIG